MYPAFSFIWPTFLIFVTLVNGNTREERSLLYSERSLMGLFIAIAVPIELPDKNVFVSYNFEGNYYLPKDVSEIGDMTLFAPITEISREGRSIDRRLAYSILEDKLEDHGYKGRPCLLRSICEAAEAPMDHHGVLGGILHIIFTPSSSNDEALPSSFYLAEKRGSSGDCSQYVEECPSSLLDVISKVVHHENILST